MCTSRPSSLAIPRTGSPAANYPSLSEILSNTASPPWTLSAFTAYLSQNHCLETLEFLIEAERYRTAHLQLLTKQEHISQQQLEAVRDIWQRLLQTYILPYSPREVNLPAPVRDRLLHLGFSAMPSPPQPSELDEAIGIVQELMNDSVLVPFCESVTPTVSESHAEDETPNVRHSRSRLRIPKDLMASAEEVSHSPKAVLLPLLGLSRSSLHGNRSASGSASDLPEGDLATDDSSSPNSIPGTEPVTPPTTPPTSDFTFNASPNTLQRAISGNGWKRMSAKLGLSRKNRSTRQSQPTNLPSTSQDDDLPPLPHKSSESPL